MLGNESLESVNVQIFRNVSSKSKLYSRRK